MSEIERSGAAALSIEAPRATAERLRAELLDLASWLVRWVVLPTILLLDGGDALADPGNAPIWILIGSTVLVSVLLGLSGKRSVGYRAAVLVLYLLAASGVNTLAYGPVLGTAPMVVGAVVVASLYLGWRGLGLTIAGLTGVCAAVVMLPGTGVLPYPDLAYVDATRPMAWIRESAAFFVGSLAVGGLLATMLGGFERSIARTRSALIREREEREERERTQGALAQSQRLEAVGRLAGGVAHDFNNALVVMLGASEMLRKRAEEGSVRAELLRDMVRATHSATEVTRQLLSLGRRDIARARVVAIDELLEKSAQVIRRILPSTIELSVEADSGLRVQVDPAQVEQVLLNMAINARDAMPDGGLLRLRTLRDPESDGAPRVVLEVRDDGTGMSEEVRSRVFEPFFTTKPRGRGTGLGLATAQRIVAEMGGTIGCESAPEQGTCFRVVLPSTEAPVEVAEEVEGRLPSAAARILLVEDRDDVRQLMCETLVGAGHRVAEAQDQATALDAIESSGPFDLLCTDAVMPNTRVTEVIARFREVSPEAPVLVCSGHVEEDLLRRGIETGAFRYLPKPFTPDALLEAVAELIDA